MHKKKWPLEFEVCEAIKTHRLLCSLSSTAKRRSYSDRRDNKKKGKMMHAHHCRVPFRENPNHTKQFI